MDEMEKLSKSAKELPSAEVLVFKRDGIETVYLGKDFVAIYPKGQNPVLPVTVQPATPDPKVTQLEKELNDLKAKLVELQKPKEEVKNQKEPEVAKPKSKREENLAKFKDGKMTPAETLCAMFNEKKVN